MKKIINIQHVDAVAPVADRQDQPHGFAFSYVNDDTKG